MHSTCCIPSDSKCPLCHHAGYIDYHGTGDGAVSCNCCERSWVASGEELAEIIDGMNSEDRRKVLGLEGLLAESAVSGEFDFC
jgi:hypothetical protein